MAKKQRCPKDGRHKQTMQQVGGIYCHDCKAFYDDDPDEGGDYSDHNPAARLEREERQRERKLERLSSNGNRRRNY